MIANRNPRNPHLTEEEILRYLDGETSPTTAEHIRTHCASCPACRSQLSRLEATSTEFADLYRSIAKTRLEASSTKARLHMKSRLASAHPETQPSQSRPYFVLAVAATLLCAIALVERGRLTRLRPTSVQAVVRLRPDTGLTPGATRPVDLSEICPAIDDDRDPAVPPSLKKVVFQEYGMNDTAADQYQVDYLINPQLGGTSDIRNLWPEPYGSRVWNARVKDELEDRLHLMVCNRQIDLESAQREIATDWIAAYKKYFHTASPS